MSEKIHQLQNSQFPALKKMTGYQKPTDHQLNKMKEIDHLIGDFVSIVEKSCENKKYLDRYATRVALLPVVELHSSAKARNALAEIIRAIEGEASRLTVYFAQSDDDKEKDHESNESINDCCFDLLFAVNQLRMMHNAFVMWNQYIPAELYKIGGSLISYVE